MFQGGQGLIGEACFTCSYWFGMRERHLACPLPVVHPIIGRHHPKSFTHLGGQPRPVPPAGRGLSAHT